MAVPTVEEPMLYRLDRLDNIVRQLEEIRGGNRTPKSSTASTPSSLTVTSEGQASSLEFSPRSLEKHCRPMDAVIVETGVKGTLIERLVHVEERVTKTLEALKFELPLKLEELEEEIEAEKRRIEEEKNKKKVVKKSGFKQLVKSCVTGNSNKSKQS